MLNCNPNLCISCKNQFSCQRYRSYVGNIQAPQSPPIQQTQSNEISPMSIEMDNSVDSSVILHELYEFKDSIVDTIATRYFAIENQIKPIIESVTCLKDTIDGLYEKFSKLDKLFDMIEDHAVKNENSIHESAGEHSVSENGMALYNGETESEKILVEKKGLFGLGKTKWVEEEKK